MVLVCVWCTEGEGLGIGLEGEVFGIDLDKPQNKVREETERCT